MASESTEGVWRLDRGEPSDLTEPATWRDDGVEDLTYSNPFGLDIERVWFDGKVVYASEQGELDVDLQRVKVAQEYQIVYGAELGAGGKPVREPDRVEGQFNIYGRKPTA